MSKDLNKTRCKFILFNGEVIALFPDLIETGHRMISSYAHIGQHGIASRSLMHCKAATKGQYESLKRELESYPFEYNLLVMNKG